MMTLEQFETGPDIFSASLINLVDFLQEQCIVRHQVNGLPVIFGRLCVVFGIQPVGPSEISPGHGIGRIHLHATFPLCDCIVFLLVIQQVAQVVMRFGIVRTILHRQFEDLDSLQTERIAIFRRQGQSLPEQFPGSLLVTGHVGKPSQPHLGRRIRLDTVSILHKFQSLVNEAIMQILQGKFHIRFHLLAHECLQIVSTIEHVIFRCSISIKRIHCKHLADAFRSFIGIAAQAENAGFQVHSLEIVSVVGQCLVQTVKRHVEITGLRIHLCEMEIRCRVIIVVPYGTIQGIESSLDLTLFLQNQTKIVNGLAILRTCIIMCLTGDCTAQISRSLVILTSLSVPDAHSRIGAGIARISTENLIEIVGRVDERIVELEVPEAHKIALLGVFNLLREFRALDNRRKRLLRILDYRLVGKHLLSIRCREHHFQ
ncbi:unknown [Bacteroides sp. CAG:709]|nr:unknown [Bacteroides sp. CAG:709]